MARRGYDIIPVGKSSYVKFNCEDRLMLKIEILWSIARIVLVLEDWRKNFQPFKVVISKVAV